MSAHTIMYHRIQQYCEIVDDYALYFKFAKSKPEFICIYPKFWKDVLQIIALSVLECDTVKERNNAIGRNFYSFARHVLDLPLRKTKTRKKYKKKCKKITECWLCKREKQEYMRQSLTPGHKICGTCYIKIKRGNKYMNVFNLIFDNIKEYPEVEIPGETQLGICCITGEECQTIKRKGFFSSNFTNTNLLKAPDSDRVGLAAAVVLKYRPERSSWFVSNEKFLKFDKNVFRDMFLNGVHGCKQWSIYVTTSYKKHGAFVAKINSNKYGVWRFEMLDVNASDGKKNRKWYSKIFNALTELGIGRSIIESADCYPYVIKKIGLQNWLDFYNWAKDKYQSPLYKLCCYLLPSQKELKENGKTKE